MSILGRHQGKQLFVRKQEHADGCQEEEKVVTAYDWKVLSLIDWHRRFGALVLDRVMDPSPNARSHHCRDVLIANVRD